MGALTDKRVRDAKPSEKPYKLTDGEGMYLLVAPTGAKSWCMKYRFAGKEKKLTLGKYPSVSLSDARKERFAAKETLEKGFDPAKARYSSKSETFEQEAEAYFESKRRALADVTINRNLGRFKLHVFPTIGHMQPAQITEEHILQIARDIEKHGTLFTGKKCISLIAQVFKWLRVNGKVRHNPAADMTGAVRSYKPKNNPHLSEKELPEFVRKLTAYTGGPVTRLAALFLLHTFVRTSEMRFARWEEIDENKKQWRIPAERMKMQRPHIVPLSSQVLDLLNQAAQYSDGKGFIFPAPTRTGTLSENAILYVIDGLGYKGRITGHGFRGTASTILNEHGFGVDAIERQLAHAKGSSVRAAYNHAQYLPERTAMMQWWSDFLSGPGNAQAKHQNPLY